MKTYIPLIAAFLLLLITTTSRAQSYLWANQGGDSSSISGVVTASDDSGNVYVAGYFNGGNTAQFDGHAAHYYSNTGYVTNAIFIAKYNSIGEVKWVQSLTPTTYNTFLTAIIANSKGEVYLTGSFTNPSSGLLKYDLNGNLLWSAAEPSTTSSFCLDAEENILLTSVGSSSPSILKYTKNGTLSKTINLPKGLGVAGITTDLSGNIYLTGSFFNDTVTVGNTVLKSKPYGQYSCYVAKLDSSGNGLWARQSTNGNYSNAISADNKANVYITGNYNDTLVLHNTSLAGSSYFTTSFDSSGSIKWISNGGGQIISTDSNGNSYVASIIDSTIISFDSGGAPKWTINNIPATDLAIGKRGELYIAGAYNGYQSFGSILLSEKGYANLSNLFIAALQDTLLHYPGENIISGTVFNDLNKNCIKDINETGINGAVVLAQPGSYFAVSDTNGNYTLNIDTGAFTISQFKTTFADSTLNNQECPALGGTYLISYKTPGNKTFGLNFADTLTDCSILTISLSTDESYTSTSSTGVYYPANTYIHYSNIGDAAANNAIITLYYPGGFTADSASVPYTTKDDTIITFSIGTVNPGSSSAISVLDLVFSANLDCNNIPFNYSATISASNCVLKINSDSAILQKTAGCIEGTLKPSNTTLTGVTLYPNPTKGNFTLLFKEVDSYQITVYNNLGQQVQTININGAEASLAWTMPYRVFTM